MSVTKLVLRCDVEGMLSVISGSIVDAILRNQSKKIVEILVNVYENDSAADDDEFVKVDTPLSSPRIIIPHHHPV